MRNRRFGPSTASISSRFPATLLLLCGPACIGLSAADIPRLSGAVTSFEEEPRFELSWTAPSGVAHRVQVRDDLAGGPAGWITLDVAKRSESGVGPLRWMAPESLSSRSNYRLEKQDPALDAVEPAVFAPDVPSDLYVTGAGFESNDTIRVDGSPVGGVEFLDSTLLRFNLPPQGPGPHRIDVVRGGVVVATFHVESADAATAPDRVFQGPPEWPPAGPLSARRTGHVTLMKIDGGDDDCDSTSGKREYKGHVTLMKAFDDGDSEAGRAAFHSKKGYDYYKAQSDMASAGLHNNPAFQSSNTAGEMPSARLASWLSRKGYDYYQAQSAPAALAIWASRKGYDYYQARADTAPAREKGRTGHGALIEVTGEDAEARVALHSGEVQFQEADLAVPGRGLDFAWVRTYRSRTGRATPQGVRWSHSYDVRCAMNGSDVDVYDGTGRRDTFRLQTNGVYTCPGFFREGTLTGGVFRLAFADTGSWEFNVFDGTAQAGRLARIRDRAGNLVTCDYDSAGRLARVVDTLGRTNSMAYDAAGRVASVTDCTGRTVTYAYYGAGETGGAPGDLKSVTSPRVVGTPTGNDFPTGKTVTYTYTSGSADDRENHLLLSASNASGQPYFHCDYVVIPGSEAYLRCDSYQRWTNAPTRITYLPQSPSPSNRFAVLRCIVNDPEGSVSEHFFDSRNRCVTIRDFTGRAAPGLPVTDVANRPAGKLRLSDPDFYETQQRWNSDSLLTGLRQPGGNRLERLYESDFNPATPARKRGDLRVWREFAAGEGADTDGDGVPDLAVRAWLFEHDPRFGSDPTARKGWNGVVKGVSASSAARGEIKIRIKGWDGTVKGSMRAASPPGGWVGRDCDDSDASFITRVTDPRGVVRTAVHDAAGNGTRLSGPLGAQVDCAYDAHGQLVAVTNAPDAQGRRRVDTYAWSQGQIVACVTDAGPGGLALTETFVRDALGNATRLIDETGQTNELSWNALGQLVECKSPPYGGGGGSGGQVALRLLYDINDNLVGADVENRDETGALDASNPWWSSTFQFDPLRRCVAATAEVDKSLTITNRFEYDGRDRLTAELSPLAVSGAEPGNRVTIAYDERGLPYRVTHAPGTAGELTAQADYTPNGDVASIQWEPHKTPGVDAPLLVCSYDGFDRLSTCTDPLGNVARLAFDASDNLRFQQWRGETNDVPGGAGNRRLAESRRTFDALDRCVSQVDSFFDVFTELPIGDGGRTRTWTWTPDGRCSSATDDRGHTTSYAYDGAGRLKTVTDPRGHSTAYQYDAAGRVTRAVSTERSDLGGPDQSFVVTRAYDALGRCVAAVDGAGNTNRWHRDSLGRVVRSTDPRGNDTCRRYDGLGRLTEETGYVGPCDAGITISHTHVEYDANSRVAARTDANGNRTAFAYDVRDRLAAVTNADGTASRLVWSPRSNLVVEEDSNGTVITNTYDLLDRCVRRDIAPGPAVAATTTFELLAYDGLSRLTMASNDASRVEYRYDSLGHVAGGTQDGLSFARTHDAEGNCLTLAYPGGRVATYSYDELGRASGIGLSGGGLSRPDLAAFFYEGPDRLARISRDNGISTLLEWDGMVSPPNEAGDLGFRRVSRVSHEGLSGTPVVDRRSYRYDGNGNKTSRTQDAPFVAGQNTLTNEWTYDALDRLVRSQRRMGPASSQTDYALDGQGNRVAVTNDGLAGLYGRDATLPEPADFQVDQYTTTPSGLDTHDAAGNLASRTPPAPGSATRLFNVDYAGRLVGVMDMTADGTVALVSTYSYDPLGRRIGKTVFPPAPAAPETTRFVYDGDQDCDGVIIEIRAAGLIDSYIHKIDDGLAVARATGGGELHHVHADELGTALALTDGSGTVVERFEYDDYGAPAFLTADGAPSGLPESAAGFPFLFRGLHRDGETGFLLAGRGRYAHADTGRFVSRRPQGPDGARRMGANAYTFAGDNPWSGRGLVVGKEECDDRNTTPGDDDRYARRGHVGRHTPFQNPYRPQFRASSSRDILKTFFETGDIPTQEATRDASVGSGKIHTRTGHVTLMK